MSQRWSLERAQQWGREHPWYYWANFLPSTAINQLEMWMGETFDAETIDRELGFAEAIGMNAMRVYLHDLVWANDRGGFFERIRQYLDIAAGRNIDTLFVIFDDCWLPDPVYGPQKSPEPCRHNPGWVQSPGRAIVRDPSRWAPLADYVADVLSMFGDDGRVLGWDLYNEPGNGHTGEEATQEEEADTHTLPLLTKVFEWARQADPSQPLTVGYWRPELEKITELSLSQSDILSFHCYEHPQKLIDAIGRMEAAADGRPIICTEYMARGMGSTFYTSLPILRAHHIGAINWGLVTGKSQTIYPWNWDESKGEPEIYFHDILRADGSFLYPAEESVIRAATDCAE
ncbi:MAG: glycoside hydrolase 5 family protein [Planctomycetota bacterium]|jgi:hypothetical protein